MNARVLAILHGLIGDTLMRVPALRALREARPGMELLAVADPLGARALAGNPLFDAVFAWDRRAPRGHQAAWIRDLRRWGPDVAIDFYFGSRTPWVARLSGAQTRIGPARNAMARWLFTHPIEYPLPADVHMVERFGALVAPLGAGAVRKQWEFPIHPAVQARMEEALGASGLPGGDDVVFVVGAGDESKRLAPEVAAELVRRLAAERRVWLVQDQRDPELGQHLAGIPGVRALPALGLHELGAVFSRSGLVVVPDTGTLHVALGCAPRVLTFYQSTDPAVHAADRAGHRWCYEEVCEWQPCDTRMKHLCQLECTRSVDASTLHDQAQALFSAPPWNAPDLPARDPDTVELSRIP